jgi:hypothetical protein
MMTSTKGRSWLPVLVASVLSDNHSAMLLQDVKFWSLTNYANNFHALNNFAKNDLKAAISVLPLNVKDKMSNIRDGYPTSW